jgi:hypothetical protein
MNILYSEYCQGQIQHSNIHRLRIQTSLTKSEYEEFKVEKVVQPVNLVERKYLSNHSLTENIWGKSRYILLILAYHRNLSAKA